MTNTPLCTWSASSCTRAVSSAFSVPPSSSGALSLCVSGSTTLLSSEVSVPLFPSSVLPLSSVPPPDSSVPLFPSFSLPLSSVPPPGFSAPPSPLSGLPLSPFPPSPSSGFSVSPVPPPGVSVPTFPSSGLPSSPVPPPGSLSLPSSLSSSEFSGSFTPPLRFRRHCPSHTPPVCLEGSILLSPCREKQSAPAHLPTDCRSP